MEGGDGSFTQDQHRPPTKHYIAFRLDKVALGLDKAALGTYTPSHGTHSTLSPLPSLAPPLPPLTPVPSITAHLPAPARSALLHGTAVSNLSRPYPSLLPSLPPSLPQGYYVNEKSVPVALRWIQDVRKEGGREGGREGGGGMDCFFSLAACFICFGLHLPIFRILLLPRFSLLYLSCPLKRNSLIPRSLAPSLPPSGLPHQVRF